MTKTNTIQSAFFSISRRSYIVMSNIELPSGAVFAHPYSTFIGIMTDKFAITLHGVPFPFYFTFGKRKTDLDLMNERNGLQSLRFILASAGHEAELADAFVEQTTEFFLSLNN